MLDPAVTIAVALAQPATVNTATLHGEGSSSADLSLVCADAVESPGLIAANGEGHATNELFRFRETEWTEVDDARLHELVVTKIRREASSDELMELKRLQRKREWSIPQPDYDTAFSVREKERKLRKLVKALEEYVDFVDAGRV